MDLTARERARCEHPDRKMNPSGNGSFCGACFMEYMHGNPEGLSEALAEDPKARMVMALDLAALAREATHAYFGLDYDIGVGIEDHRGAPWAKMGNEVSLWPEGYNLTSPDDGDYDEMEQSGEIYGTSEWVGKDFTMFVVYNNGTKEGWVVENALLVAPE